MFALLWTASASLADDKCKPVEVAPGVKQASTACVQHRPKASDLPAGQRRGIHIGNTDLEISGRVRTEYGVRR